LYWDFIAHGTGEAPHEAASLLLEQIAQGTGPGVDFVEQATYEKARHRCRASSCLL
jgi:hypothetical protein